MKRCDEPVSRHRSQPNEGDTRRQTLNAVHQVGGDRSASLVVARKAAPAREGGRNEKPDERDPSSTADPISPTR